MADQARSKQQRKADVLARLAAPVADAWVATSGDKPHLVPLTLGWHDERILLATSTTSPTARNLTAREPAAQQPAARERTTQERTAREPAARKPAAHGLARIALGGTRDVVMIDAVLERTVPVGDAGELGEAYAAQNDWDPRTAGDAYGFLVLRPERIQAWREQNEIAGRTLMRDGVWLV